MFACLNHCFINFHYKKTETWAIIQDLRVLKSTFHKSVVVFSSKVGKFVATNKKINFFLSSTADLQENIANTFPSQTWQNWAINFHSLIILLASLQAGRILGKWRFQNFRINSLLRIYRMKNIFQKLLIGTNFTPGYKRYNHALGFS